MNMYSELLDIAKKDLQAARVLYINKFYPQAVFYFQQSVEKANKSFALITKEVKEEELHKDIGHKAIKIYEKSVEEQLKKCRFLLNFPELRVGIFKKLDVSKEIKRLTHSLSLLKKIGREDVKILKISSQEIQGLLKEIEHIEKELKDEKIKFSKYKLSNGEFNKMKKEILETDTLLFNRNHSQIEILRSDLEKLNKTELERAIRKFVLSICEVIPTITSLYYLTIITLPHSVITRYPKDDLTPLKVYTRKLPIVEMLPKLMIVQNKALKRISILNKKLGK